MGVIPIELPQPGDVLQVVVTLILDLHEIYVHRVQWSQQLNDLMKQMKKYYEVRQFHTKFKKKCISSHYIYLQFQQLPLMITKLLVLQEKESLVVCSFSPKLITDIIHWRIEFLCK